MKTYLLKANDLYRLIPLNEYTNYGLDEFTPGDCWNKRNHLFVIGEESATIMQLKYPDIKLIPNYNETLQTL